MKIKDFPKLESPFEREEIEGKYVVVPNLKEEYRWIIDPSKVTATEKFDGTNCSVLVEDGNIKAVFNRNNRIDVWKHHRMYYEGIKNAIEKGRLNPEMLDDGQYFGELIGEKIQGNPYKLKGHTFLPFDWILKHYLFKFYYGWLDENIAKGMTDEEIFEKFSDLMYDLKSLWFRKMKDEKPPEGIVFHNKETGEMCKLRRDMFNFYYDEKRG